MGHKVFVETPQKREAAAQDSTSSSPPVVVTAASPRRPPAAGPSSPSKAKPLVNDPESPAPTFKKRKDKKRSISNGELTNGHAAKKVRTFYENHDKPDSDDEDAGLRPPRLKVNGDGTAESRKQARKKAQKERRERAEELLETRKNLPVWWARDHIIQEIEKRDTVVVLGETGSGKTTQIPQFLLNSTVCRPQPRICVTQPRRVAATSLAKRVAEEFGCPLGGTVGYTVRFDDCSSPKTRLKYVTDGTLLQEILADRLLEAYDVVVIDEAHERTLRTDMILGFLKEVQRKRKEMVAKGEKGPKTGEPVGPLKIVVMSATLDAKRFSEFYGGAEVLYVKGREHKVTLRYLAKPVQDYLEAVLKAIFTIHYKLPAGDVLVFLSGQEDIENVRGQLESYLEGLDPTKQKILVCPLYARLTPAEQNKAFNPAPPNTRKIILATNVAETSITISGIKYVIDPGFAKEKVYHPNTGMDSLLQSPISRSSAQQRAGRAGRESAGVCFRLYTEQDYHKMRPAVPPEIQRCSLSFAILHLLAAGQEDVFKFDYMDRPENDSIAVALMELASLGALDDNGKINALGRKMASLPLDPRQAKTLLASFEHGCTSEVIDLLALLGSADQLLSVPFAQRDEAAAAREKFIHRTGDHMMLLYILKAYEEICQSMPSQKDRKAWCKDHYLSMKTLNQVLDMRKQLRERLERLGMDWKVSAKDEADPILLCLLEGHFTNTAMRMPDNTYRRASGNLRIKIHPSSILQGKRVDAVIFSELVFTTAVYARITSSIPLIWLRTKVNSFFQHKNIASSPRKSISAGSPAKAKPNGIAAH